MKKILASVAAAALTVSAMAVATSAASLTVDQSKIYAGDLEGNGNIRIEIYNEYGAKDPAVDLSAIADASEIAVTFTIAGVPAGSEYDATLGYASDGWAAQDWDSTVKVTGDGTYTVTSVNFEEGANGAVVFVVDIKGLATDTNSGKGTEGFEFEDNDFAGKAQFAKDAGIIVSNVKVEVAVPGDEGGASEGGDKGSPSTGVEGVAVVAGLAIIAAGAVVVAKKRG